MFIVILMIIFISTFVNKQNNLFYIFLPILCKIRGDLLQLGFELCIITLYEPTRIYYD